ncbi:hypothetical protein M501DRAFT_1032688 [Patellaria atrata CBS 101060]|uniref:Uncharacterized protein n=1 Tax=Patellaria atrata CBS 101060 TaxID=1346257 RepID=A0A9P4VQ56_9PEZI|nr:hypothetical protein M501DRAFT_1032688 [Patellaria atrata CBS 101060]
MSGPLGVAPVASMAANEIDFSKYKIRDAGENESYVGDAEKRIFTVNIWMKLSTLAVYGQGKSQEALRKVTNNCRKRRNAYKKKLAELKKDELPPSQPTRDGQKGVVWPDLTKAIREIKESAEKGERWFDKDDEVTSIASTDEDEVMHDVEVLNTTKPSSSVISTATPPNPKGPSRLPPNELMIRIRGIRQYYFRVLHSNQGFTIYRTTLEALVEFGMLLPIAFANTTYASTIPKSGSGTKSTVTELGFTVQKLHSKQSEAGAPNAMSTNSANRALVQKLQDDIASLREENSHLTNILGDQAKEIRSWWEDPVV